jgi:hypothetical protein
MSLSNIFSVNSDVSIVASLGKGGNGQFSLPSNEIKGTFKRFYKTKAMVIEVKVSEDKYKSMEYFINYFN